ncbi:MAG: glycosyltransferase [Lachnospiraceae bacterium]|nr:glycosyltransferase [Lachnospiraceae bacterium]
MKTIFFMKDVFMPAIKEIFTKNGYHVMEGNFHKDAPKADSIFSLRYEPEVAEYCFRQEKKYIVWTIDSPHTPLYHQSFYHESNYIFLFDYDQYCTMLKREAPCHVYYLPLATDVNGFEKVIQNAGNKIEHYRSDVSFLGRLYKDPAHSLFDKISYLPPYVEGYLNALMKIQHKMWGADILRESISNQVWEKIKECVKLDVDGYNEDYYKETIITMMYQKVAQQERMEMCSMLAKEFDFALYTQDSTEFDFNIKNRGYVNYVKEMPLVFAGSKINVNITLRSISSGIPLRCLDIMACGGFLLTNYQAEIGEYFIDGEEVVIYNDFQDMQEKIRYYLCHEDERKRIANQGKEKVAEGFSYERQIGKMLAVLEKA